MNLDSKKPAIRAGHRYVTLRFYSESFSQATNNLDVVDYEMLKLSPHPHSPDTLGLRNRNASFNPSLMKST